MFKNDVAKTALFPMANRLINQAASMIKSRFHADGFISNAYGWRYKTQFVHRFPKVDDTFVL